MKPEFSKGEANDDFSDRIGADRLPVARILVERGEKPVLMDHAAQNRAINEIVDPARVTLIAGNVLRPLSIVDALR